MATPSIRIDVATVGNGTTGQSRTDGVLSQVVTLNDTANSSGSWSWTLLVPFGSSTTLTNSTTSTPTFTPDIAGSYLAFCTYNGSEVSFSLNAAGEKVTTQGGLAVLKDSLRIPTAGETTQFDSDEGWAAALDPMLRTISGVDGGSQGDVLFVNSSGELERLAAGTSGQVLSSGGAGADPSWATGGSGDVSGPASATDNAFARYDLTTGKLLQNSTTTQDDSGNVDVQGNITVSGTVDGRDVASDGTTLDTAVLDADFSAAEGMMRKVSAGTYTTIKSNLAASTSPGTTDDTNAGYGIGSLWCDTTGDAIHMAIDVTASAAVWKEISAGDGSFLALDGSTPMTGDLDMATNAVSVKLGNGSAADCPVQFSGVNYGFFRTGTEIHVALNGTARVKFATTAMYPPDNSIDLGASKVAAWANGYFAGYIEVEEMAAPTGVSAACRIYAADNGGKTTLYAIFPTGAAQTIAAEP